MKKILITGGMGNLGSWLTNHFSSRDYEVTVLTKRQRNLEFEQNFKLITCDISSLEDCKAKLVEQYDVIIHTASMNDNFVEGYAQDALIVNTLGTRNMLEAIKDKQPSQFIYLSTFHIYGKYSGEITEETDLVPRNDYGATHLFAEYYVKQYHANHKIPYSIVRLSNSYGCPKDYNSSKWYLILNDLSKMAFEKQEIVLRGNGKATRDFIWMGDVCSVLEQLSKKKDMSNTFNISGEQAYSLLHVANAVQQAYEECFGKSIDVKINTEDKSEARPPVSISSQKIKQLIPYQAEDHFKEEALKIFDFLKNKK